MDYFSWKRLATTRVGVRYSFLKCLLNVVYNQYQIVNQNNSSNVYSIFNIHLNVVKNIILSIADNPIFIETFELLVGKIVNMFPSINIKENINNSFVVESSLNLIEILICNFIDDIKFTILEKIKQNEVQNLKNNSVITYEGIFRLSNVKTKNISNIFNNKLLIKSVIQNCIYSHLNFYCSEAFKIKILNNNIYIAPINISSKNIMPVEISIPIELTPILDIAAIMDNKYLTKNKLNNFKVISLQSELCDTVRIYSILSFLKSDNFFAKPIVLDICFNTTKIYACLNAIVKFIINHKYIFKNYVYSCYGDCLKPVKYFIDDSILSVANVVISNNINIRYIFHEIFKSKIKTSNSYNFNKQKISYDFITKVKHELLSTQNLSGFISNTFDLKIKKEITPTISLDSQNINTKFSFSCNLRILGRAKIGDYSNMAISEFVDKTISDIKFKFY